MRVICIVLCQATQDDAARAGHPTQAAGAISRGSMAGGGTGSGRAAGAYIPWATSLSTRFAVSSVRVACTCSLRTARMTTVASRNLFSI